MTTFQLIYKLKPFLQGPYCSSVDDAGLSCSPSRQSPPRPGTVVPTETWSIKYHSHMSGPGAEPHVYEATFLVSGPVAGTFHNLLL
jgi:hypothetical protein